MQQCPIPAAQTGYGTLHTSWGAGFCSQLIVLLKRGFVNAVRNWVYYWARIAMFLALALLAGTVWFDLGNSFGVPFSPATLQTGGPQGSPKQPMKGGGGGGVPATGRFFLRFTKDRHLGTAFWAEGQPPSASG